MTTFTSRSSERSTTAGWPMYAALGAGTALVLTAIGTFWDLSGNDTAGRDSFVSHYLPVVAIVIVATALVFGLVVRTASASSSMATRALVLGVLGLLTVLVFWTGLPAVLAFGAVALALGSASEGRSKVALALAAVTLGLAVVAAIVG